MVRFLNNHNGNHSKHFIMTESKDALSIPDNQEELKETAKDVQRDLREDDGEQQNVIKEALKKEQQPKSADDVSPLQNTHAVGTSGGDQRAKDVKPPKNNVDETDKDPSAPEEPAPIEEPGKTNQPPTKEYDEPDTAPPLRT